jgi:hypothetical protein
LLVSLIKKTRGLVKNDFNDLKNAKLMLENTLKVKLDKEAEIATRAELVDLYDTLAQQCITRKTEAANYG